MNEKLIGFLLALGIFFLWKSFYIRLLRKLATEGKQK
tara:strand:+ start:11342 stop:11452 length:111 start_codon:yes stop_codon:yes gene_type:complete